MDKTPPQLDPKLKEAYDRVMGTVIPPKHMDNPPPPTPTQTFVSPTNTEQTHVATSVASPSSDPVKPAKKKGKIPFLIIVLAVIIFLVAYAVVWVKVFGLTVPFLNP